MSGTARILAAAIALAGCERPSGSGRGSAPAAGPGARPEGFTGSAVCRPCHERFHGLWETSRHGLAMQRYRPALAREHLAPQAADIEIRGRRYRVDLDGDPAAVSERGPKGEKRYPIAFVLGGKNVYYFLTPLAGGKLQTLPLAFDVRRREWFDTSASAIRHIASVRDEALDWTERPYTFNTSCHGCHVSQLSTNYDPATDTYRTTWAEAGINCETCHGPAAAHVRACEAAGKGSKPPDLAIIRMGALDPERQDDTCAPCHAKMVPLTASFVPGERFFDHFDLSTLEDPDFHPDGRDLGENYTYTLWRMNPCAKAGRLHCLHCHTSSGRYRFAGDRANDACLPCHAARVADVASHSHHAADSAGNICIACHMPMTEFARMRRSDHSLRPPAPAATIAFGSPNACTICHADRDAAWADAEVRAWHGREYQAQILRRGRLIAAARKGGGSELPEIIREIAAPDRDEIVATSLIRLVARLDDERKTPASIAALRDASPLVRAAAAAALAGTRAPPAVEALLAATGDDRRLVRIRAASALAALPREGLGEKDRERLARATAELEASLRTRPDDWSSQYNLGNYFIDRADLALAVQAFERAAYLRPDAAIPLVNASIAYARLGDSERAESALRRALAIEPSSAEAHFNLGLLLAERGSLGDAESHLRAALASDPTLAAAAYNLAVLLVEDRVEEAVEWCRKAVELRPDEPRYAFTLAFTLHRAGYDAEARQVLLDLLARHPDHADARGLLAKIERNGLK